jgi:nucleoside-diphosphate-sugar epimerase
MLCESGKTVTVLDSFQTSSPESLASRHPDIRIVHGDLRDSRAVDESLEGVTGVVHLAGVSDGRAGRARPHLTEAVNVDAFKSFALQARDCGCRRFLLASTFGVYGYQHGGPLTESLPPDPQEPYSASKLKAEGFLTSFADGNFAAASLRLAMVFGYSPSLRLDFIVNRFIRDALERGCIDLLGGAQIRPQIHVRDAGQFFLALLDKSGDALRGGVYNACGLNWSLEQIALEIQQVLGTGIAIHRLPGRSDEHTFVLDSKKLEHFTGLQPAHSIAYAVREFEDHFLSEHVKR